MSKVQTLPVSAEVIARVRKLRQDRNISARKLAELMAATGFPATRTSVAQGECGYLKAVSVDWVVAAAKALDVSADVIFRGPKCASCVDAPPQGFTCNACGTEAT